MTTKRDYYEILGIDKKAPIDDIKSAYRKLAMQYHPDRNKAEDAEEKFKEISEAYAVLSDQDKRNQYNQFGHIGIDQKYSQEDIFRGVNFEDILRDIGMGIRSSVKGGDFIFNIFFGGGGGKQGGQSRGPDILYGLEMSLEDVAIGKQAELEVPRSEKCDICHGNGAQPGTSPRICQTCNGKGQISRVQKTPFGQFATTAICQTCRGDGNIIDSPCTICHGTGYVQKKRKIEVKIPPGVDNGSRLRVPGEGEIGRNNGPSGDLYVDISIKPHTTFARNENNLIMEATISFAQATLGDDIVVPTLDGKAKVRIPPGTQNGHILRLKGKGVPSIYISNKGDQLIRIKVAIPTKLTDKQRKFLQEFAAAD